MDSCPKDCKRLKKTKTANHFLAPLSREWTSDRFCSARKHISSGVAFRFFRLRFSKFEFFDDFPTTPGDFRDIQ